MKNSIKKNSLAVATFCAIASAMPIASAQETPEEVSSSGFILEEIIVTARKREEGLQDAPISIAAFTALDLENRQIDTSDKLTQVTPNLTFSTQSPASGHNSSSQIFIRGIGQTDYLALTDPGVGFYVDGVYFARTLGATIDFLDIERIEILRGPQGTLFGRNTIGGAISLHTKIPGEEFSGDVMTKIGSDSRLDVIANINLPISDTLSTRLSLADRNQDGYVTRLADNEDVGDNNAQSARLRTLWSPSDSFSADLILEYTKEDENGAPVVFNSIASNNTFARIASARAGCPAPGSELADPRCANNQFAAGPFAANGTFDIFSRLEAKGAALTLEKEFGNVTFKSITSARDLEASAARDADNTPFLVLHSTLDSLDRQYSQEFQFIGNALSDRLNWIAGLYYFDQEGTDINQVFLPVGDISLGGDARIESKAVFGQATYDLNDKLSFTLGLRYSKEDKEYDPQNFALTTYAYPGAATVDPSLLPPGSIINGPLVIVPAGTNLVPTETATISVNDTTPLVNLRYQFNDNVTAYINYSEGFKGGGYSTRVIEVVDSAQAFQPETANSWEIGFKSNLLDSRLRLNGSIFTTQYEDVQFVVRPQLAPLTFNAGEASISGGELELTFIPTPNFLITGGIGYVDASYDELGDVAVNSGVRIDNDLQQTPELTANIGLGYTIDLNGAGRITTNLDWSYQSEIFFDAVNTNAIAQGSYDVMNASIAWENDGQWKIVLGITNLTDEEYRVAGFSALGGAGSYAESAFARPRNWSLSAKYKF